MVSFSYIIIDGCFAKRYYCYSGCQKAFIVRHSDNGEETITSYLCHCIWTLFECLYTTALDTVQQNVIIVNTEHKMALEVYQKLGPRWTRLDFETGAVYTAHNFFPFSYLRRTDSMSIDSNFPALEYSFTNALIIVNLSRTEISSFHFFRKKPW
jgi:hypothetical protein